MDLQWYYPLGLLEYSLIASIFLAFLLHLGRLWQLTSALQQSKIWIFLKFPLRIAYFTLMLIALLGPSFGYGTKYVQAVGKDIYLLIDLSKSMNVQDVKPSRLEKIKYELKNMMASLASDRVGIIIFASDAFLQCPLTYDKSAVLQNIQNLNTQLLPDGGTDIGEALKLCSERLIIDKNKFTNIKSKIAILLSDGEDFGTQTQIFTQELASKGIKLFTVGIGSSSGGRIPLAAGVQLNPNGEIVISKPNTKILENIALQTGGDYFELSQERNNLSALMQKIQQIKGQRLDFRTIDVSYNKYEYFIWIALLLICLDIVVIVKTVKI